MTLQLLKKQLEQKPLILAIWGALAAFGAYFCTYALRKPFLMGTYNDPDMPGADFKTLLIIAQICGYLLSKFLGIKVIAELQVKDRLLLIVSLVLFSQIALLGFAWVEAPYNWPFMFLNGLPLGMVYGVIFSFLEGRRITEFVATGLSLNLVVGSGWLKSIYLYVAGYNWVGEYALPALMGVIFLPFFLLFVWMLQLMPNPSHDDMQQRSKRVAMDKNQKSAILKNMGIHFWAIALLYLMFTTFRDFRDNFAVEIWQEQGIDMGAFAFGKIETVIGILILIIFISVGGFKTNHSALNYLNQLVIFGIVLIGISTKLYELQIIGSQLWYFAVGFGIFLPYLLVQTQLFDRILAINKWQGNAGFLIYICDTLGYLGSISILIFKLAFSETGIPINYTQYLINLGYIVFFFGILFYVIYITPKPVRNKSIMPSS